MIFKRNFSLHIISFVITTLPLEEHYSVMSETPLLSIVSIVSYLWNFF